MVRASSASPARPRLRERRSSSASPPSAPASPCRPSVPARGRWPPPAAAAPHPSCLRADLTDLPFVTLDPPGSTDLDQAMHLERRGNGYRVRLRDRRRRRPSSPPAARWTPRRAAAGNPLRPDQRTPLHPPVLSEGAASLLAGRTGRRSSGASTSTRRRGPGAGTSPGRGAQPATGWTTARCSARRRPRGPDPATSRAQACCCVRSASGGRRSRRPAAARTCRARAGGVRRGGHYRLTLRAAVPAEDWNAQLSLMTGMAAAELMLAGGVGLLRTIPPPDDALVGRFRRQAQALGVGVAGGRVAGIAAARLRARRPAGDAPPARGRGAVPRRGLRAARARPAGPG